MPGVPNVRDLGGRIGLGGRRVRQGLVYRSAGWNENAVRSIVTNGASVVTNWVAGADRTGSLACILNALLGVGEDELAKDWEATGFVNEHVKLRHDIRWDPLVRAFDGYPGATLNVRIEAYVKDCGFTDGDIARFRAIMMEDGR